jgi:hypothetical protein
MYIVCIRVIRLDKFFFSMSEHDFPYLPRDLVRQTFSLSQNMISGLYFLSTSRMSSEPWEIKSFQQWYKWNIGSNHKTYEVSLATIQGKVSQLPIRYLLEKLYFLLTYKTKTMISIEIGYLSCRVNYTSEGNKYIPK